MKKCTDITSIDYYLQGIVSPETKTRLSKENKRNKKFKILIQDDVKNSVYLVDA